MGGFLIPVIRVIIALLDIYWWIIIIMAVASWLTAFGVINTYNRNVALILDFLYRITDPVLRPVRNLLPSLGGIDVSPVIVLLIIWFLEMELGQLAVSLYRM